MGLLDKIKPRSMKHPLINVSIFKEAVIGNENFNCYLLFNDFWLACWDI